MSKPLQTPAEDRPTPSIDNQIQEVERQAFFLRHYTLPSQVASRKMTQGRADQTLACLESAAATLRMVRDGYAIAAGGSNRTPADTRAAETPCDQRESRPTELIREAESYRLGL